MNKIKKIYLAILLSSLCATTFAQTPAKERSPIALTEKYLSSLSSSNVVFDELMKGYLADFKKRESTLLNNIEENNNKQNKTMSYLIETVQSEYKIDDSTVGDDEQTSHINTPKLREIKNNDYDFKRVSKLKLDYQKEQIDNFVQNENAEFVKKFKEVVVKYKLTREEKEFLSKNANEVSNFLKSKIIDTDTFFKQQYSYYQGDFILVVLKDIKSFDNQYKQLITNYNSKYDSFMVNAIWKYSGPKIVIPK